MDKCILIRKEKIDETLASVPTQGKRSLEPLKSLSAAAKIPFNIMEDSEVLNNFAETHQHENDLWLCLEGEASFTYGGEMVNPSYNRNADGIEDRRESKAKEIRGGETAVLKPGDWLWIPAGQPHQHQCATTTRLVIIKIPLVLK